MTTETLADPAVNVAEQLLEKYFAIRGRLADPQFDAEAFKPKLAQIETHILTRGTAQQIVKLYIAKRDDKAALKDAYERQVEATNVFLDQAEAALKRLLRAQGLNSVASDAGTAFRKNATSATLNDKEVFKAWVLQDIESRWAFQDIKANKTAVTEFKEEHGGALPPGVNWREEEVIQVRR